MHDMFMRKAIELSHKALNKGETPVGCVIVLNNIIIAQTFNRTKKKQDISCHAEVLAMRKIQKKISEEELRNCILYSTVEPCPMCSFLIRELKIGCVVFAIFSPTMGGYSRFHVLQDLGLSTKLPKFFGTPPKVLGGVLSDQAEKVWDLWRNVVDK